MGRKWTASATEIMECPFCRKAGGHSQACASECPNQCVRLLSRQCGVVATWQAEAAVISAA
jgi:hypothetical protein